MDIVHAGCTITQLEAVGLYSCFRLASAIHDLRAKGYDIRLTLKIDPLGKQYGEYRLANHARKAA